MQFSVQNQRNHTVRWKQHFSNLSVWSLIVSNLLIIIWALIEQWSVFVIMWIYWAQSVGIGIVWFIKMISLKEFSTTDCAMNNRPLEPGPGAKIKVSMFFLVHYGGFHLVYALFLMSFSSSLTKNGKSIEFLPIVIGGAIFLVNQLFSFFYNIVSDRAQKPNIGKLMFFPYARIIPMHITLMGVVILKEKGFDFDRSLILILFLLLKTFADATMHTKQLKGFADKSTAD